MRISGNSLVRFPESLIFVALIIISFLALAENSVALEYGPRNIIVMISDGCGYYHVDAASIYQHGESNAQVYHRFPVQLGISTYASGGKYDPDKAWKQFNHVMSGATDSAAAATTLSTGVKTYSGAIGVGTDRKWLIHMSERAEEMGKATGVVTSVEFAHATPAGFVAHNTSRNNYEQIAQQMILDSTIDVIMGCGHPLFSNSGKPAINTYQYVGGKAVWEGLVAGAVDFDLNGDGIIDNSVEDADGDGDPDPWTFIEELAQFRGLASGIAPKRAIGIPQSHTTLQQGRSSSAFNAGVPTLEEMTRAALNVLDDDPEGLLLMIEGGAIDWASHSNQSQRMIEEEIDFSNAVAAVVEWVEMNSSWAETILIVTGDHETGYLTGPGSGPGPRSSSPSWPLRASWLSMSSSTSMFSMSSISCSASTGSSSYSRLWVTRSSSLTSPVGSTLSSSSPSTSKVASSSTNSSSIISSSYSSVSNSAPHSEHSMSNMVTGAPQSGHSATSSISPITFSMSAPFSSPSSSSSSGDGSRSFSMILKQMMKEMEISL